MAVDTTQYSQDGIAAGYLKELDSSLNETGSFLRLQGINAADMQREVTERSLPGNNTIYKEDSKFLKYTGTVTIWAYRADMLKFFLPGSLVISGNKATFTETSTGLPTRFRLYLKSDADGENGEDGVIVEKYYNCICTNWSNPKTSGEYVSVEVTITAIALTSGEVRDIIVDADGVGVDFAETDSTAPTISAVSPADSATGVAVDAAVTVSFSEKMIESSLSGIRIWDPSDGSILSTGVTIVNTGSAPYVATVAHSAFSTSTTYNLFVPSTCRDLAGNEIGTVQETSFTTTA